MSTDNKFDNKTIDQSTNDWIYQLWTGLSLTTCNYGAITNGIVICILIRNKPFHNAPYRLSLFMAITDGIMNAIFIQIEVLQTYYFLVKHVQLVDITWFCVWEAGSYAILFTASVYTQMLLGIIRWCAVFVPIWYREKMKTRRIAILWFIVCIMWPAVYYYAGSGSYMSYPYNKGTGDCDTVSIDPSQSYHQIYAPMLIAMFGYVMICWKLLTLAGSSRAEVMKRSRGSLALFVTLLMYFTMLIPFWVALSTKGATLQVWLWVKLTLRLGYATTPTFYFILDRRIRRGLLSLFCRENSVQHKSGKETTMNT